MFRKTSHLPTPSSTGVTNWTPRRITQVSRDGTKMIFPPDSNTRKAMTETNGKHMRDKVTFQVFFVTNFDHFFSREYLILARKTENV